MMKSTTFQFSKHVAYIVRHSRL